MADVVRRQAARSGCPGALQEEARLPSERQTPVEHTDHCAAIPHPFISLLVFWCPHLQRWAGWVDYGSSTHDTDQVIQRELTWGPFDTDADVSQVLVATLSPEVLHRLSQLPRR